MPSVSDAVTLDGKVFQSRHAAQRRRTCGHQSSYDTKMVVVVVVVVEIFIHGAVKATVTNAPQSQLNK